MLLVLQAVHVVLAHDARYVRERVIGAVDDRRRALATQDGLVALGAPVVAAVLLADEVCRPEREREKRRRSKQSRLEGQRTVRVLARVNSVS